MSLNINFSMKSIKPLLLNSIDDFVKLQKQHTAMLTAGKLDELPVWQQQRQQLFRRLCRYLDMVGSNVNAADDHKFLDMVTGRIAALLTDEQLLSDEVLRQRQLLYDKLGSMRKGKKAVRGYSMSRNLSPSPKFMSNRT